MQMDQIDQKRWEEAFFVCFSHPHHVTHPPLLSHRDFFLFSFVSLTLGLHLCALGLMGWVAREPPLCCKFYISAHGVSGGGKQVPIQAV